MLLFHYTFRQRARLFFSLEKINKPDKEKIYVDIQNFTYKYHFIIYDVFIRSNAYCLIVYFKLCTQKISEYISFQ